MKFSKIIIVFACIIIAAAFSVAVFHWYITGFTDDGLEHVLSFVRWLVKSILAYMAKTCIENKAKIEKSCLGQLNNRNLKEG
ncbi:MAG: hypothetical protein FWB80_00230 [Defluviitaleaceae bacterium]|nr:hypothetical protein [Defluviitaleaceae bacterium]